MLRHGIALVSTLCAAAALAQTAPTTATIPPQYAGVQTRIGGVFVTPIPNIPFSAVVQISSTRLLPDGSSEMRKSENQIARNSGGVIYNEMRRMMPVSFTGKAPLMSSHVYDPSSRLSTFWEPTSNVARATVLNPRQMQERKPFTIPVAGAVDTDLGESSMAGVSVHGLRRTFHIEPAQGGTLKPLVVIDEYWYSEDLHLVMLQKHDDSRTGEQIVAITDVQRAEPDASALLSLRVTAWSTSRRLPWFRLRPPDKTQAGRRGLVKLPSAPRQPVPRAPQPLPAHDGAA